VKFNVFPNYKIPIDYISYDTFGERYVRHIGWINTPDIEVLKNDHYRNQELIGDGIKYENYRGFD
jgi:hypothetical protein